MNVELEEKTRRVAAMLDREGLDAVLLNAQHNFAWLSCGGTNGIDHGRDDGAATLMVTRDGRRYVLANNIEMPRMLAEELSADDFQPVEFTWQAEKGSGSLVLNSAREIVGSTNIATDIALFADASAIESKIAACRYQLTADELDRFRALGRDAGMAMQRTIEDLKVGETELSIAEKIRHALGDGGMESVVTLVGADDRIARFRHPVPTANTWNKTLLLVTCARRNGLIASLSRIVCVGAVPADLQQRTNAAAYVNASLMDATRPGATGAELYETAANAYFEAGYGNEIDLHHQGGAAGYRPREWTAHQTSTEVVQLNQAFAWNASVTGTKVEETCIAGADGVEIITASPAVPVITTEVNGRQYHSPGIISL